MGFLSLVGNSLGCSASGERLVSAARDGDIHEAKALLEYNPRLARYLTVGVRNSPLHYSAAHGHHEIVLLLLESGVDIDLRNYRGQTALMQACQHGHWEVVQILILFKANIHRVDYLNGGTSLHLAALNGHSRCIRLLLADYIPSSPNVWSILRERTKSGESTSSEFNEGALYQIIDRPADGGITALHLAALNGHPGCVQLLLDLGASVSKVTVKDGATIDLIGVGSTPLHYAAYGGNAQCCQILVARGASLDAENVNGCTPLMVARSWNKDWLEEILSTRPEKLPQLLPSPYLCLPMMSIFKIARECGWRSSTSLPTCVDPCVVCLERKCTVSAEGCGHEFCTRCALYLCSTNNTSSVANGAPGSIACPLCRHGIVSFLRLVDTRPLKETARASLPLSFCSCSAERPESASLETSYPDLHCGRVSSHESSFRSMSCQRFPQVKLNPGICIGAPNTTSPLLVPGAVDVNSQERMPRYPRSSFRRSNSFSEPKSSWFCSLS